MPFAFTEGEENWVKAQLLFPSPVMSVVRDCGQKLLETFEGMALNL